MPKATGGCRLTANPCILTVNGRRHKALGNNNHPRAISISHGPLPSWLEVIRSRLKNLFSPRRWEQSFLRDTGIGYPRKAENPREDLESDDQNRICPEGGSEISMGRKFSPKVEVVIVLDQISPFWLLLLPSWSTASETLEANPPRCQ